MAALRAIYEAGQSRIALISGARDDLEDRFYANSEFKNVELVLSSLSFGPGPLRWADVPTMDRGDPGRTLDLLVDVARARSPLPLFVVALGEDDAEIDTVKVVAPGLRMSERDAIPRMIEPRAAPILVRPKRGRTILFVGPTLRNDPLPESIERRPPAVAGDLARLLGDPPERIGLVDGSFETGPSVWHKELLDLIAAGVQIYGAASLGALRAAELHGHGMHGVGQIFSAYKSGSILRDDAVMLVHGPAELNYRALSLPLVDAEAAILELPLTPIERRMLQRIARTMSFRKRSWAAMLDQFRVRTGRACSVTPEMAAAVGSLKRSDALLLVDALLAPSTPAEGRPRPPLTGYYRRLLEQS